MNLKCFVLRRCRLSFQITRTQDEVWRDAEEAPFHVSLFSSLGFGIVSFSSFFTCQKLAEEYYQGRLREEGLFEAGFFLVRHMMFHEAAFGVKWGKQFMRNDGEMDFPQDATVTRPTLTAELPSCVRPYPLACFSCVCACTRGGAQTHRMKELRSVACI